MSTEIIVDEFTWIRETGPNTKLIKLLSELVILKDSIPRDYKNSIKNKLDVILELEKNLTLIRSSLDRNSVAYIVITKIKINLYTLYDIVSGNTVYIGHWMNPYAKKQVKRIKQNIEAAITCIIEDNIPPFCKFFDKIDDGRYYSNF